MIICTNIANGKEKWHENVYVERKMFNGININYNIDTGICISHEFMSKITIDINPNQCDIYENQ